MVATTTIRATVHKVTTKSKVKLITKVPMLISVEQHVEQFTDEINCV